MHARLQRLVVEDPKSARVLFCELLDADVPVLEHFLARIAAPGDGRLRQMVANAVRERADKGKVVGHLVRWRAVETDEFTKRAIVAALADVDLVDHKSPPTASLAEPLLVEAYRYVSNRLSHKVRNSLMGVDAAVMRISDLASGARDDLAQTGLLSAMAELKDALRTLGRVVEYDEGNDEFFRLRSVCLLGWIEDMTRTYGIKYSPIDLRLPDGRARTARIIASDFLLDTIFWNLWINSHQAVDGRCSITIESTLDVGRISLILLDNGTGFPKQAVGVAFREQFSTGQATGRGRGLLEVQEAIERLQGSATLIECGAGDYRVCLVFPLEV
ncbi:MAG TPA: ATP-binding protein [Armatimonadota bacterium]|jgi:signal transduction histidine kinase